MGPVPRKRWTPIALVLALLQSGRRGFFVVLGTVNLLFLAADALMPHPHPAVVLTARVLLSAALFGGGWLSGREWSARRRSWFHRALGVALALAFGALVWGSGGYRGVYAGFYALLPLIFAITVPDDPWAVLCCAASVVLVGAPMTERSGTYGIAFWLLGSGSIALYATVGAWFQREHARREQQALFEAEQARLRVAELEHARALDDRLALLGTLVAGVAHEVRSPLAVVAANVNALKEEGPQTPDVAGMLRDVELGVSRIGALVEDLRSFARNERDVVEPNALAPMVETAGRLARVRLKGVATLQVELPQDLPEVRVSRRRVEQVLVNLLLNAGDAVASTGRQGRVRVGAAVAGGFVEVAVEDDGPGVSPEIAPRLFQPFATTKGTKGTGLGLALSRGYVESCGGRLEAGKGSLGGARFAVFLPVAPAGK